MASTTVLVLTHDRDTHLLRQQAALAADGGWDEIVVAFVDQTAEPWANRPAGVRTVHPNTRGLALAAGRNAAAAAARGDVLVFLDVDCIPAPGAVRALALACTPGQVVMAEPRYLPPGWSPAQDPAALAWPHPARAHLPRGRTEAWPMFWSLGFAIGADDFARVGGFDETYTGYGGEDTDLAFRMRDAGLELWFDTAQVWHQAHAVHRPPLHHLDSIVVNARRFHARWGVWPMEGWLAAFAERGLVAWDADELRVLRLPTAAEIEATRQPAARF